MTLIIGIIYLLFAVVSFVTLMIGLDTGNKTVTRMGAVMVVLWGIWAVVH